MLILIPLPLQLRRIAAQHIKLVLDKLQQISQSGTTSRDRSLSLRLCLRSRCMCRMRTWMLLSARSCWPCTRPACSSCYGCSMRGCSSGVCRMAWMMRRVRRMGWMYAPSSSSEGHTDAYARWERAGRTAWSEWPWTASGCRGPT